MSKSKVQKEKRSSYKKEIRSQITDQLQSVLSDLKERIGEKKFDRRVSKATKLLAAGLKPEPTKAPKAKSPGKDTTPPEKKAE
jgi:hypothetical protein